ncbi:MAG: N-acetylmuramic acid 6-phosphate etherase [Phycisphaerae bacterium]
MIRRPARASRRPPQPGPPRGHLATERRNPRSLDLDRLPLGAAFDLLNSEDATIAAAVRRARPALLRAVRLVAETWRRGGRLIYVGAGTSGRLGVLDAAECPPTFRVDRSSVVGLIAGGRRALWRAVEGAEDDRAAARRALAVARVGPRDALFGIAAGGTTPYVLAALAEARRRGARTLFLACVPARQAPVRVDVDIRVVTGPEVLTGSTRMKAGLATKMALNAVSTLAMVQLGKVYQNLMVDLDTYACRKLTDRATRILVELTGLDYAAAGALLRTARGQVKTALVMQRRGLSRAAARRALARAGGRVRDALQEGRP